MQPMNEKRLHNLKLVYGIALAFIALTLLSSSFLMQYAIRSNGGDSRVINLSGRQRMLSQRLTKCVLALERPTFQGVQNQRVKELTESFASWKAAHLGLQRGDEKLGLPQRENSAEIRSLFAEMEPFFTAMRNELDRLLRGGTFNPADLHTTAEVMLTNEPRFLPLMDKITFQFDKEAKERISSMQRLEMIVLVIGLLILAFEFHFVFRPSLSQLTLLMTSLSRKGEELEVANRELQTTNGELEESQERIMESLNCAQVIQGSILPRNESFDRLFSDWLTIYKPCDIVGGDLYWLREINGRLLLAVIDCTGHGVPGAIMTMTVNSVLNHVVDTISADDPARILKELNRVLQETLHFRRDDKSMVDAGLDIILCCIDPTTRSMICAGAGLSLYLLTDGTVTEIKGERQGIGYSTSNPDSVYTNHVRDLGAATTCYATTDGFFDESGGEKGFGFGRQRFKDMIRKYAHYPLQKQKEYFVQTLDEWRGTRKQRDDITAIGFRI